MDLQALSFDRKTWEIIAQRIKEQSGVDVHDPNQLKTMENRVAVWRNNRLNRAIKHHSLFKASEYINGSLYSGDQRIDFTFNNWKPDMQSNRDLARKVGAKCYYLAKQMVSTPAKVLLTGKPGTGKTSLAMAMLNYLCDENYTVMTVSTLKLASLMNNMYEKEDIREHVEYVKKLMTNVDVLLLDDFGSEGSMKSETKSVRADMQSMLFDVADARLNLSRNEVVSSTIVTTNSSANDLEAMYNPKLISRLLPHQESNIVKFDQLDDVRV